MGDVIILTLKFKLRVDENDELNLLLDDERKKFFKNIDLNEEITNISKKLKEEIEKLEDKIREFEIGRLGE